MGRCAALSEYRSVSPAAIQRGITTREAGEDQAAGLVQKVVLGDDDALGLADRILAHDRHAAAQEFAGRRIAHPAQGVDAQPLAAGGRASPPPPAATTGRRPWRPAPRSPASPSGREGGGEGGDRLRLHRRPRPGRSPGRRRYRRTPLVMRRASLGAAIAVIMRRLPPIAMRLRTSTMTFAAPIAGSAACYWPGRGASRRAPRR